MQKKEGKRGDGTDYLSPGFTCVGVSNVLLNLLALFFVVSNFGSETPCLNLTRTRRVTEKEIDLCSSCRLPPE